MTDQEGTLPTRYPTNQERARCADLLSQMANSIAWHGWADTTKMHYRSVDLYLGANTPSIPPDYIRAEMIQRVALVAASKASPVLWRDVPGTALDGHPSVNAWANSSDLRIERYATPHGSSLRLGIYREYVEITEGLYEALQRVED